MNFWTHPFVLFWLVLLIGALTYAAVGGYMGS
jgi:hypothetical protein